MSLVPAKPQGLKFHEVERFSVTLPLPFPSSRTQICSYPKSSWDSCISRSSFSYLFYQNATPQPGLLCKIGLVPAQSCLASTQTQAEVTSALPPWQTRSLVDSELTACCHAYLCHFLDGACH